MKDFRYMAIVAAAALGLAVAGCGSSGSDTATAPPVEDTSLADAQTAAMTAETAADAAATDAEKAAKAQEANKDHDPASYAIAQNAAGRARAAADAAAAANIAAQAATTTAAAETQRNIAQGHQATAEKESANAMMYAGMVATAKTTADNAAMAAAEKAAANKVAMTKETAIGAHTTASSGGDRPFDGTAADADPSETDNYRLTVKHTGSAVEVTVVDGDFPAKNDPKFSRMAEFGKGQMLVRDVAKAREIIVVHTDIEAPENVPFGTASGYRLTVDVDTDTSAPDSYLVQDTDASKLGGSRIVSADPGTKVLAAWARTGDAMANVFAGTLDGAAGTFRCQDDCTITTTAGATADDDNIVRSTGTLWFTPAAGATVSVPDDDYLTYGFWLDTTTKDGEVASYDAVQTFARSSLPLSTDLASVTGTAKYEGDAAGVYFHETSKEDGTTDTATSGRFTADVALTARFDDADPLRKENTIEGAISNFDLEGGQDNSWNVKVSATIDDAGTLSETIASGMAKDNGSLSGQFHGDGDAEGDAPAVLIGEFNANFVNGAVAGAYGARKQQ